MCDPVQQMAYIAETTIAKEEEFILQLERSIAARTVEIARLDWEQLTERTALTLLKIRKEKAEAFQ